MRLTLALLFAVLVAHADEWDVPKPKSNPLGKPMRLKLTVNRKKVHKARVRCFWEFNPPGEKRKVELELATEVRAVERNEQGMIVVEAPLDLIRVVAQGDDLTERIKRSAPDPRALGHLNQHLQVARGGTRGLERLQFLGRLVTPTVAWVMPYLPEKPVHVGDVWELPAPYLMWNVGQGSKGTLVGHVSARFVAVEERDGVKGARIKTVFGLTHKSDKGVARIKGEMDSFLGLDGYLRKSTTNVKMQLKRTDGKLVDWSLRRDVAAGPADPTPPRPKPQADWSRFMGDVPFVVGYEAGMKEAKFTGRPPMFVVTLPHSRGGAALGATAWKDKAIIRNISGYTPVLVDGQAEPELLKKHPVVVTEPAILWVGFDGEMIFMSGGVQPLDLFKKTIEIARDRCPEQKPSAEYVALRADRDAMHAALAQHDVKTAIAKLLAIRKVGRGVWIQQEATKIDAALTARGQKRLVVAQAVAKQGKPGMARKQLEEIAAEYEGHPIGRMARELLK